MFQLFVRIALAISVIDRSDVWAEPAL